MDLSKDSVKNIGVFANWFSAVSQSDEERLEEKDIGNSNNCIPFNSDVSIGH